MDLLLTHPIQLHLLLGRRDLKQLLLKKHLLLGKILLSRQELSSFLLFILVFEIIFKLELWRGQDFWKCIHLTISSCPVALVILILVPIVGEVSADRGSRSRLLLALIVVWGGSLAIVAQTIRLLKLGRWGRTGVQWRLWGSPQPRKQMRTACPRGGTCIFLLPRIRRDA